MFSLSTNNADSMQPLWQQAGSLLPPPNASQPYKLHIHHLLYPIQTTHYPYTLHLPQSNSTFTSAILPIIHTNLHLYNLSEKIGAIAPRATPQSQPETVPVPVRRIYKVPGTQRAENQVFVTIPTYNDGPTTSRIAKQKAQERLKRLVTGGEDEITFPKIVHYQTIDQYESSTAESNHTSRSESARVGMLEKEVSDVKGQIKGMNNKLDMLLDVAIGKPDPAFHSTPPRQKVHSQWDITMEETTQAHLPPPRELRRAANHDGYVDRMAQRDRFQTTYTRGKHDTNIDRHAERPYPKPYLYIDRETCQTEKQKLEVRCTLAPMEYVNATLALIKDTQAYDPADLLGIVDHLQDVTHDVMQRPWPAVRRWSQFIWDGVEKGTFRWNDYQIIQNHRVCIALTAVGAAGTGNNNTQVTQREYVCRDFQTRAGCRHRTSHMDGDIKLLHVCAFCDCVARTCYHSALACAKKMNYPPRQAPGADQFAPNPMAQHWRPMQQTQHNYPMMQQPKNGQTAPRLY